MWQVRSGHEHNFVDGRTMVHHIHLANSITGGEHNLEITLGCPACPVCKRPFAQNDLSMIDPAHEINRALEDLMGNHHAIMKHAQHHKVPIRVGPLATHIPEGHRVTTHGQHNFLHTPRAK